METCVISYDVTATDEWLIISTGNNNDWLWVPSGWISSLASSGHGSQRGREVQHHEAWQWGRHSTPANWTSARHPAVPLCHTELAPPEQYQHNINTILTFSDW